MDDPSSVIAFAERSHAVEDVARVIVDAITDKPIEVVFPPLAGRLQRVAGVFPHLMYWIIPRVVRNGVRRKTKLQRLAGHEPMEGRSVA